MKTNFESIEFNRTFEGFILYLKLSMHPLIQRQYAGGFRRCYRCRGRCRHQKVAGIISLSKLLEKPDQHAGKTVVVGGKVVKVNNGIMGKTGFTYKMEPLKGKNVIWLLPRKKIYRWGATVAFEGKIFINKILVPAIGMILSWKKQPLRNRFQY